MSSLRLVSLLVLSLLLLAAAPAAAQITADVGETWIRFEWAAVPGNNTTLVIDGVDCGPGSLGSYHLTDLRPDEEHQIQIIDTDTGTVVDSARVRTLASITTLLFFIAVEVVLALLCMVMQDPVRVILTGALGSTLGFFLFGLSVGHGALWLVVLGLVGFQALFVVLSLYNLLEDALRWW